MGLLCLILDDVGVELWDATTAATSYELLLDRMVREGVSLETFVSGSRCSPHRASVLTGLHPHQAGHLMGQAQGKDPGYDLPASPDLLPRVLSDAGRAVALFGKNHLGQGDFNPLDLGYGLWEGTEGNLPDAEPEPGVPGDYFRWMERWAVNAPPTGYQGGHAPRRGYVTARTVDSALSAVQAGVDVVFCCLHACHRPGHVPPPEYHSQGDPKGPDRYVAMLEAACHLATPLYEAARAMGYDVLCWSDNGGIEAVGGGKGGFTDKGMTTWLVGVGDSFPAGVVIPATAQAVDLYATIQDLVLGVVSLPAGVDSISLRPWLVDPGRGGQVRAWTQAQGFSPNGVPPTYQTWTRAVRTDLYKLISNSLDDQAAGAAPEELYDLVADPNETTNLADDPARQADLVRMRALLPQEG